jgi:hypothetical protein
MVHAAAIVSATLLAAASGSVFHPEWPVIATACVVSLVLVGLLADRTQA